MVIFHIAVSKYPEKATEDKKSVFPGDLAHVKEDMSIVGFHAVRECVPGKSYLLIFWFYRKETVGRRSGL